MSIWYKHLFSLTLILITFQLSALEKIPCSYELKGCLNKILQLDEAKELIGKIQKEGHFSIVANGNHHLSQQFGAFWDPCRRIITIHCAKNSDEGIMIGSIIFELHNADANSELLRLDNLAASGQIDRNHYVQGVEYVEYLNSKKASSMVTKGIKAGLFQRSAFLPTYRTFKEHYSAQVSSGHSDQIAKNFDGLTYRMSFNSNSSKKKQNNKSKVAS